YHRLHWRRDVVDKELMLRTCNRLAIAGVVFLALAVTGAVYLVSAGIAGRGPALAITLLAGLLLGALWFALPLLRRNAERPQWTAAGLRVTLRASVAGRPASPPHERSPPAAGLSRRSGPGGR